MSTSAPLSRCCYMGALHEGEAKGEIKDIGNISTYFAYPKDKSTEKAVLILSDVVGHKFINAQLVADQFAANGYFVVMPDLFNGDAVPLNRPEGFQIMEWLKPHLPPHTDPIISTVIKAMREEFGVKKIGGVGYCFGGKYVARFLKPGMIDVGYAAHPTNLQPDELKAIQGPLTIAASYRDFVFTPEKRYEAEKILDTLDVPWSINLYAVVEHGFTTRGDITIPVVKQAKEQAFVQAVEWFNEYLK